MKNKVALLDKRIEELKREVAAHERIKEVMKNERWDDVRDKITCLDEFIGGKCPEM